MKATEAILLKKIPAPPQIAEVNMFNLIDNLELHKKSIQLMRSPFNKIHCGKFLRFVKACNSWYAIRDEFASNGATYLTLELHGEFYREVSNDGDVSDKFLTFIFEKGSWRLEFFIHSMADEEDFNLTYDRL